MIKNYLLLILTSSLIFSCSDPTEEIEFPRIYNYESNALSASILGIKTVDGYEKIPSQGNFLLLEQYLDNAAEDEIINIIDFKVLSIELLDDTMGESTIENFDGEIEKNTFNYTYENGEFTFEEDGIEDYISISEESIIFCHQLAQFAFLQEERYSSVGDICRGLSIDAFMDQQIANERAFPNDTVGVYEWVIELR